jgi:hypothetical protein
VGCTWRSVELDLVASPPGAAAFGAPLPDRCGESARVDRPHRLEVTFRPRRSRPETGLLRVAGP